MDGATTQYSSFLSDQVWIVTFVYHHSTHDIAMKLDAQPSKSNSGSNSSPSPVENQLSSLFGGSGIYLIFVAIIAVLVAVIAVMIVLNKQKRKTAK